MGAASIPIRSNGETIDAAWFNTVRTEMIALGAAAAGTTETADYTAAIDDRLIFCDEATGAADITITLPTAVGNDGVSIMVMRIGADYDYDVDVNTTLSQTINGSLTRDIDTQFDFYTFTSNGTNWVITNRFEHPVYAYYQTNAGQAFADSVIDIVDFDNLLAESHPGATTTGASWSHEVKSSGPTSINAFMVFSDTTAWDLEDRVIAYVYVNGGNVARFFWEAISSDATAVSFSPPTINVKYKGVLAKGDTIDVRLYNERGSGSPSLDTSVVWNQIFIDKVK